MCSCVLFLALINGYIFKKNAGDGVNKIMKNSSIDCMVVERWRAFAYVLGKRLTPEQLASAVEEWELVCELEGWPSWDAGLTDR